MALTRPPRRAPAERERDDLFTSTITETMARGVLMAGDGDAPQEPYFAVPVVVDSLLKMAMPGSAATPDARRRAILEDVSPGPAGCHMAAAPTLPCLQAAGGGRCPAGRCAAGDPPQRAPPAAASLPGFRLP